MFARTVQASLHRSNTGGKSFGNFGVTSPFLDQCEQSPVLRAELGQGVAQGVEFLRIDGARRLRDVLVLLTEGQENSTQFLTAELVDAGVPGEPEEPRLELRGFMKAVDRTRHLDEHLLAKIFNVVTAGGHSIDEASDAMLVVDNELTERDFVAPLRPTNKVRQLVR
ncbi:MAG: hypothetical protein ABIZ81_00280 [Opitutaceae bacterium]